MTNRITLLTPILLMSFLYGNVTDAKADTGEPTVVTDIVSSTTTETLPTETPTSATSTTATTDSSASEPSTIETPISATATTDPPASEPPTIETPISTTPTTETLTSEPPATETPTIEIPTTETPASETTITEMPTNATPTTETPASEPPTTETPTIEIPTTETPASETTITETPTSATATTDPPASVTLPTETPTNETPISETPPTQTATIPMTESTTLAAALSNIPSQYVDRINTSEKLVALTFDDGYDYQTLHDILWNLRSLGVKATFFMNGGTDPELLQQIVADGHQLANHSYSHNYSTDLSADELTYDLQLMENYIKTETGTTSAPVWRAPYGVVDSTVLEVAGNIGYEYTMGWSIDTGDWVGDKTSYEISQFVMDRINPGAIVLMHAGAGSWSTPEALWYLVPALKNAGYNLLTVNELLVEGGYDVSTTQPPIDNGSTLRYDDRNIYIDSTDNVYIRHTGNYPVVTYKATLTADTTYTIKSLGSGNDRFRIAVMNSAVSLSQAGDAVLVDKVINLDNSLTEYTFHNLNGVELYVYLSNYANSNASIDISVSEDVVVPPDPDVVSTVSLNNRNVYVDSAGSVYIRHTGDYPVVTYKATLAADTTYTIKSLGVGNDRFRIAVMNSAVSLNQAGDAVLVDKVINLDNSLTEYTFHNLYGVELYIYLSNYANPSAAVSVTITDTNIPTEPTESETVSTVRLGSTNVYVPGDGSVYIQNTGDYEVVTYMATIEPNATYTIKSIGTGNDRFRIAVMDSTVNLGNSGATVLVDRVINVGDWLTEYTFRNLDGIRLYVYVSSYNNPDSKVEITKISEQISYNLGISSVTYNETNSENIYPTLFGVKTSNAVENQQPQTIGWLYYSGYDILYAEGTPTNMVKIAEWDSSLAYEGYYGPENYSPYMTADGDIIFVFRGEKLAPLDYSYVGILEEARQNPIIYPAGNYDNPFVIDFGDSIKPTAWLQNSGADFVYDENFFIFAEYTRPIHDMAYVWKVTFPFDDPANWRIVKQFEVSGSYTEGFEHGHSVSYDPFSGVILMTTGDDVDSAKVYRSDDLGETWVVVMENQEKYARMLNFVYTEDKVYWGSDSGLPWMHAFLSADRYPDGTPNFDQITEIFNFGYVPGEKVTYTTVYVNNPNGILFLDRFDSPTNMPLEIMFWSFETNSMHTVALLDPLYGEYLTYGFRNEAVNWYASATDNQIVAGFGFNPNGIDIGGNSADYRINNLVLKVTKTIA